MFKSIKNHKYVCFDRFQWLNDLQLRTLNHATRSIYLDLVCVSICMEQVGFFILNKQALDLKTIAKLCKLETRQFKSTLPQLLRLELCQYTKDKALYLPQVTAQGKAS